LSRERLPDLFRQDRRRYQGPSRFTQKHFSRFSLPQQTARFRRRETRRDTRVLEANRGRREDAESVRAVCSLYILAASICIIASCHNWSDARKLRRQNGAVTSYEMHLENIAQTLANSLNI